MARSHVGLDRAVDQFLDQSRLASEIGLLHQEIEDDKFQGRTIRLNGTEVCNFGLCSYLGLSDDPRLVEGAIDALRRYGNSYSSSVAYTALPLYAELKERIAAMVGAPVILTGTTTLGHLAALPVLVEAGDTVLLDAYAHASLLAVVPTLQAKGASVHKVPHNDLAAVSDRAGSAPGRTWYLTDGLYSMHGDTVPAEELRSLLDSEESLWVYCDDAHGLGWSGLNGRGQFLERSGWHERLVMSFGLAKSFGTMGGVIAASNRDLLETIEYTGGPMVFGGPVPPAILGAGIASADIHLSVELPALQDELLERIDFVNRKAADLGIELHTSERTPLWFVEVGPLMTAISVAKSLLNQGYYVNIAAFPVVPRGRGGVRFTVTRYNSMADIAGMLTALKTTMDSYGPEDDVIDLAVLEDD